jgi:hypothetical protein
MLRVLKPGGAVFHETLWDNPLINFARPSRTPMRAMLLTIANS